RTRSQLSEKRLGHCPRSSHPCNLSGGSGCEKQPAMRTPYGSAYLGKQQVANSSVSDPLFDRHDNLVDELPHLDEVFSKLPCGRGSHQIKIGVGDAPTSRIDVSATLSFD